MDTVTTSAYAYLGDQWVAYDSPATVAAKVAWVLANGATGGVMVWSVDLEDLAAGSPLVTAARAVLTAHA